MGEVVNLGRVRKAKRRARAESAAAANRLLFGRSRAEREGAALETGRAERLLDGAMIAPAPSPEPDRPAAPGDGFD